MGAAIGARVRIEPAGNNGFTLRVYLLQSAKDEWWKWYETELAAYLEADALGFTTAQQYPQRRKVLLYLRGKLEEEVSVDPDQLIDHGFDRVVG
jgi:hypothetical protein